VRELRLQTLHLRTRGPPPIAISQPDIRPAWGQKLAAFRVISWPAMVVTLLLTGMLGGAWDVSPAERSVSALVWLQITFFVAQFGFVQRLVRKNYRSFHLYVVRDDRVRDRRLSWHEVCPVWLWIFLPQLTFVVLSEVAGAVISMVNPAAVSTAGSALSAIRFFVVGPWRSVWRCA